MNRLTQLIKFALPCAVFMSSQGHASKQNLVQNYENSTWSVSSNPFACSLKQRFDNYALLEVKTVPAQQQQLVFTWLLQDKPITSVHVLSRIADWQPENTVLTPLNFMSKDLKDLKDNEVQFSADMTPLLRVIKQGGWLDTLVSFGDEQLRLTFTNTHSDKIVADYQQCLANLSPLSWEQARDHQLQFASGQRTVTTVKDLKFLKDLVRYISLDSRVSKVLVDGHTDNTGSPLSNRLLSKERADDVAARLIEFGLPKDMLEVRAHGQRYPIIKNSEQGRSSNRRVLVRLFRHSS
jgi:outer membrane protein OmpA-like peptidoglycan-associated protein